MLVRRIWVESGAGFLSLAALAVCGLLINALISKSYGPAGLGVFNQVYAIYILASQGATLGCQFSVLRYVSEHFEDRACCGEILASACLLAVGASIALGAAISVTLLTLGGRVYSQEVVISAQYALPGLLAFALNKIMLNGLAGARKFVLFNVLTTARYSLMGGIIIALVWTGVPVESLSLVLSVTEVILLPVCAFACWFALADFRLVPTMVWINRNAHFGVRSIGGGAAVELNTRADVLILGLFSNDTEVGRYSFAAFFVEGLLQIPMLVRRYVDPAITSLLVDGRSAEFANLLARGRNLNGLAITSVFLLAVLFYPWYAAYVGSPTLMEQSYAIFAILSVGAVFFGTYAIFTGVLSQGGKPVAQTLYNFKVLGANILLNLFLAPHYEALGAAIAMGLSLIVGALLLRNAIAEHYSVRF